MLERHAALDFVLIGDSGQHDPEIYRSIAREFPGRIRAIYVRDVVDGFRDAEVRAIVDELEGSGVPMLLVPDTLGAARHAATLDLIDARELARIEADVDEDLAPHEAADEQDA